MRSWADGDFGVALGIVVPTTVKFVLGLVTAKTGGAAGATGAGRGFVSTGEALVVTGNCNFAGAGTTSMAEAGPGEAVVFVATN